MTLPSTLIDVVGRDRIAALTQILTKRSYQLASTLQPAPRPEGFAGSWPKRHQALEPDTECLPYKPATDVVVQGNAVGPRGASFSEHSVAATVGGLAKRIRVVGDRVATIRRGKVSFSSVTEANLVPVVWSNALGGGDPRVNVESTLPVEEESVLRQVDHPGIYPRNPFGCGYVVVPRDLEGVRLPNLEDPEDRLTPERLIVEDPRDWWKQPLPWCFDWMHPVCFPRRNYFMGAQPWFPGPEDERMPEVQRGFIAPNYRSRWNDPERPAVDPSFFQGASHGMVFKDLAPGTPIRVEGMHPEKQVIGFDVPRPPKIEFELEGTIREVEPRLHHVVCRPNDLMVNFVYGASTALHRAFIPGVHKKIPVAVRVDGGEWVRYQAPTPIREQLNEAMARQEAGEGRMDVGTTSSGAKGG
ncbi:MAG: DUF2169 domain-containing protein [Myxococcota bacterium]